MSNTHHIKQATMSVGLNSFALDLICESLLRQPWVESMHKRGETVRLPWPVNRSDAPGWAGVEVTLRPLKAGDKIAPAVPVQQCQDAITASDPATPSLAVQDVLAERRRQIEVEGWTHEHDDETHDGGDLAAAGAAYALNAADQLSPLSQGDGDNWAPDFWPWTEMVDVSGGRGDCPVWRSKVAWWKPKNPRHDLVRAAALLIAEIERLDRFERLKGGAA